MVAVVGLFTAMNNGAIPVSSIEKVDLKSIPNQELLHWFDRDRSLFAHRGIAK